MWRRLQCYPVGLFMQEEKDGYDIPDNIELIKVG